MFSQIPLNLSRFLSANRAVGDVELNEDNFYMKIIDLNEIYNFLVLSFFI